MASALQFLMFRKKGHTAITSQHAMAFGLRGGVWPLPQRHSHARSNFEVRVLRCMCASQHCECGQAALQCAHNWTIFALCRQKDQQVRLAGSEGVCGAASRPWLLARKVMGQCAIAGEIPNECGLTAGPLADKLPPDERSRMDAL